MRNVSYRLMAGVLALVAPTFSVITPDAAHAQQQSDQFDWNGLYGGANAGAGFGSSDFLSAIGSGFPFFEGQVYPGVAASGVPGVIAAYSDNDDRFTAFIGGVQVGYNYYANGILLGLEADADYMRLRSSSSTGASGRPFSAFTPPPAPLQPPTSYAFQSELEADYLLTLRPRIGLPVAGGILYGTGGLAVTQLEYKHSFAASGGTFNGLFESASASDVKLGWTAGGGFELPIGAGMTIKAEYLFTQFDDIETSGNKILGPTPLGLVPGRNVGCGADTGQGVSFGNPALSTPQQCFSHSADLLLHLVRVGVNFKF